MPETTILRISKPAYSLPVREPRIWRVAAGMAYPYGVKVLGVAWLDLFSLLSEWLLQARLVRLPSATAPFWWLQRVHGTVCH